MAPSTVCETIVPAKSSTASYSLKLNIYNKAVDSPSTAEEKWPTYLDSPLAWQGSFFPNEAAYTYTLSEAEIAEVDRALHLFKELGLDVEEVGPRTFPLPSLCHRLQSLALELHNGRGFFVLRGLDPASYSREDNTIIYVGIASHVAGKRGKQNDDGDIFTHIREAKQMVGSQHDRPVRDSTLGLSFHTDTFCDILAMQTLSCAAKGGKHILASGYTVYNELATTRPDLLETLASPAWPFDPRSPHYKFNQQSLLYHHKGHVMYHFVREPLTGFDEQCRFKSISLLSSKQLEALNAIESIAQKHQLVLSMQSGDLSFVNNFAVLHSREAFEDDDKHTRYLLRMWLKNERLAWDLPPTMKRGNDEIFGGDRMEETWNFLPAPRLSFKIIDLFGP